MAQVVGEAGQQRPDAVGPAAGEGPQDRPAQEHRPRAERQRRYLIMMGIRLACFVIAVVLFVNGGRWLTAIPAVGAIVIPYFAVVFANGGREPSGRSRFRPYEPNLPQRYVPPAEGQETDTGS